MTILRKEYRKPTNPYIGEGPATRKLYKFEDDLRILLEKSAKELGKVLGYDAHQFWTHSLPEALRSVLEAWETGAAIMAAISFLESKGFEVKDLQDEG